VFCRMAASGILAVRRGVDSSQGDLRDEVRCLPSALGVEGYSYELVSAALQRQLFPEEGA
jgi:hypothetical protein